MAATEKEVKWLIAGANGQLGRSLQDELRSKNIECIPLSREEMDITNSSQVKKVVSNLNVGVIVNAAAYTNVEKAEVDQQDAFLINETGARNLARTARENNARFLHFSTDYVFSGEGDKPRSENSLVNPLSVYGKSKLAGEIAVMQEFPENSITIRTAWLYSPYGKNFYKTMLNLALKNSEEIKVVGDQIGQPTNTHELASLAISAVEGKVPAGIYHGSNSGSASWYDFAIEIFRLAGADTERVKSIKSKDYEAKAPRPEYSVLDNSKWLDFGVSPLGPWQESVFRAFSAIRETFN